MPGHLCRIAEWQMFAAWRRGRQRRQRPIPDASQPPPLRLEPRGPKALEKYIDALALDHLAHEENRLGPPGCRRRRVEQSRVGTIQAFSHVPIRHAKEPHQAASPLAGHEEAVEPATQAEPEPDESEKLPGRVPQAIVGHADDRTALLLRLRGKPLAEGKGPAGGEHNVGRPGRDISPRRQVSRTVIPVNRKGARLIDLGNREWRPTTDDRDGQILECRQSPDLPGGVHRQPFPDDADRESGRIRGVIPCHDFCRGQCLGRWHTVGSSLRRSYPRRSLPYAINAKETCRHKQVLRGPILKDIRQRSTSENHVANHGEAKHGDTDTFIVRDGIL